ncbi:MAG: S41 family peptidase [Eubacterium sp.]|nr:S41 family peptidase [Eubacterium sp.]
MDNQLQGGFPDRDPREREDAVRDPVKNYITDNEKESGSGRQKRFGWFSLIFGMVLMLLVGFFMGRHLMVSGKVGGRDYNNSAMLNKMKKLEAYIEAFYLNDVDTEAVENGVYRGLLSGLGDPYSTYYSKQEYQDLMDSDSGGYEGIGVTVYKDSSSGYVVIEQVMKDQPAYNAGVENGDIIISVDGTDTAGITLTETVNKIKKGSGDSVKLTLLRKNQTLDIEVKKSHIEVESVVSQMKENQIGYISVSQFIENTDEQFVKAVDDLTEQGMKGLVLDLRDNGGGLLDSCINMVSRIIPEGDLIVYTEDKNGHRDEFKSNDAKTLDLPIVILVNGNTASASEIMTGCLKDYKKATVLGSTTFGKGIVQNVMPLGDGSAIKLTVSKYYTPSGHYIHEVGIEPDEKMEYTAEEWAEAKKEPDKDKQMIRALELLGSN